MTGADQPTIIGVIGLGVMGRKIASLCLSHGFGVLGAGRNPQSGIRGLTLIKDDLRSRVTRGRLGEDEMMSMLSRMRVAEDYAELSECEMLIEAISENHDMKMDLYSIVEASIGPETIVASNTSSLSISELSTSFRSPSRFVGMHFFNPPNAMKLVEVKCSPHTSSVVRVRICEIAEALDRTPIVVPDEPGYYVNRILFPAIIEAIRVLESSGGDPKDIDSAMKLGANLPMGPLELADYIGNDVVLNICGILRERTDEDKFNPPAILKKLVSEGRLGRKSGEGFHRY